MEKTEISLTDFINFVNKSGTQKLNQVRQIKNRTEYEPWGDFYKPIREGIQQIHKTGKSKEALGDLLKQVTDSKKLSNYPDLISGYKKFWGRKQMNWFVPPHRKWSVGDIVIRINPELGLEYGGKFYVIKLFFKDEKISKYQVDQILALMEYQLRSRVNEPEIKFALLDVRKGKLYENKVNSDMLPLLLGEAHAFDTMWKNI